MSNICLIAGFAAVFLLFIFDIFWRTRSLLKSPKCQFNIAFFLLIRNKEEYTEKAVDLMNDHKRRTFAFVFLILW